MISRLLPLLCRCRKAGLEAVAVVAGLQDVVAIGEVIEQRFSHFGIVEDARDATRAPQAYLPAVSL